MKKIIVSGHGHFATGLQSTMELLAGKNEDIMFVDFTESDTDVSLKAKYEAVLAQNPDSEFLFFCDLVGGTPYKTAATLAYDNESIEVVAGCNVGSLIEILFTKESYTITDLARQILTVSQNATGLFEKRSQASQEDMEEDGI
jgi:PTS system N-acetylgalactosamine-specific IIA component